MLKKRVIATIIVKDGIAVKSINFKNYFPLGKPEISAQFFNDWGADEIILLDISSTKMGKVPDYHLIRKVSKHCKVPLTIGGGIHHIKNIEALIRNGADKVVLNQICLKNPSLIEEASKIFGDQCILACIDGTLTDRGYFLYDYMKGHAIKEKPAEFASRLQDYGVGEVLINSIDNNGSYKGFDINLINSVCESVTIPVIGCGGAGHAMHFIDLFNKTSVSAAAAGNFFHYTEHSIATVKSIVTKKIPIRNDTYPNYEMSNFDSFGRLIKKNDKTLEEMLFHKIKSEII